MHFQGFDLFCVFILFAFAGVIVSTFELNYSIFSIFSADEGLYGHWGWGRRSVICEQVKVTVCNHQWKFGLFAPREMGPILCFND